MNNTKTYNRCIVCGELARDKFSWRYEWSQDLCSRCFVSFRREFVDGSATKQEVAHWAAKRGAFLARRQMRKAILKRIPVIADMLMNMLDCNPEPNDIKGISEFVLRNELLVKGGK